MPTVLTPQDDGEHTSSEREEALWGEKMRLGLLLERAQETITDLRELVRLQRDKIAKLEARPVSTMSSEPPGMQTMIVPELIRQRSKYCRDKLAGREEELIRLFEQGLTKSEIARQLNVSFAAVKKRLEKRSQMVQAVETTCLIQRRDS